MLKMVLVYIIMFTTGLTIVVHASAGKEKSLLMKKEGVAIYEMKSQPGKNHFMSMFTVNTNLANMLYLLLKTDNYTQWVSNIHELNSFSSLGDSIFYSHAVVGIRSIIMREGVVRTTVYHHSKKKSTIRIKQRIDHHYPYDYEHETIKSFNADWKLTSLGKDKVAVELSYYGTDQHLPDFITRLIRKVIINRLHQLSVGIRNEVG